MDADNEDSDHDASDWTANESAEHDHDDDEGDDDNDDSGRVPSLVSDESLGVDEGWETAEEDGDGEIEKQDGSMNGRRVRTRTVSHYWS